MIQTTSNAFKGQFKIFNFRGCDGKSAEVQIQSENDIINFVRENIQDSTNICLLFRGTRADGLIYCDDKQVAKFKKVQ
jgi:hypothetical protein